MNRFKKDQKMTLMSTYLRHFIATFCFVLLASVAGLAQNNQAGQAAPELNLTVGEQRIKFVPTRPFQEMRLNVFNSQGELVYIAATAEAELLWPIKAENGDPLSPGLYAYVLTLKYGENDERQHKGHFIIEKTQDQLWLTTADRNEISGSELTVARTGERTIAGMRERTGGRREVNGREVNGSPAVNEKGEPQVKRQAIADGVSNTPDRIAKFDSSGSQVVDSIMLEVGGALIDVTGDLNVKNSYQIGGEHILSNAGTSNLFAGVGAGQANTTGFNNAFFGFNAGFNNTTGNFNAFFGKKAGLENTTGVFNAFFGADAGRVNTTGFSNAFFGTGAGLNNTTGNQNSFFGAGAGHVNTTGVNNAFFGDAVGFSNTTGENNAFFGYTAGLGNTTGNQNSFFGTDAGRLNTTGSNNAFFGQGAGNANTTGSSNTIIGDAANVGNGALTFATAIGAGAVVANSNTIILGRSGGQESVSVPGALNVTGALTASGASLTNLNAANIATGTLGVARGGTGLSASGAAGNYLRSNGTAWVSSALQVADIPAGSGNYIQNTTTTQAAANFNISGNGTAGGTLSGGVVEAATQYNLGGNRILSNAGNSNNLFAGVGAGAANTTGTLNAFFGTNAGLNNTSGSDNTFVGANAGQANTTAHANSFFGFRAGNANTGGLNAFFGASAGLNNTSGGNNAFFGANIGTQNTTGSNNSFVGANVGNANTTGGFNAFFGTAAGNANTTGASNAFFGQGAGSLNTTGSNNTIIGNSANVSTGALTSATALGSGAIVTASNQIQLGRNNLDTVSIGTLAGGASTHVCINGGVLSSCSSSQRYKQNVQPLRAGLNLIQRLRPVTFDWKERGEADLGLIAEEVGRVEPLLVTHNRDGVIEGVKYDQLTVVLINAVKELKTENETLKRRLKALETRVQRSRARR